VDGICTADPSIVPEAMLQPSLTYEEALELSRSGAQVIHPRAVELAHQYRIGLRVKNTFNPDRQGTLIEEVDSMENFGIVRGVALDKTQSSIDLYAVPKHYSILDEISALPDFNGLCIDSIFETESQECGCKNVCLLVRCSSGENVSRIALALKSRIEAEKIAIDTSLVRLSAVGRGLTGHSQFTVRFARALKAAGINVKHLTCSDNRITGVVAAENGEHGCKLLHAEFFSQALAAPRLDHAKSFPEGARVAVIA
jgi:aspartate kinase